MSFLTPAFCSCAEKTAPFYKPIRVWCIPDYHNLAFVIHIITFYNNTTTTTTTVSSNPSSMSGETKLADVATQLQQRMPVNRSSFMRFFEWYHKTYIKAGRAQPVAHVMVLVGVIGYSMEHNHIKHELEHAREEAAKIE